MALEFSLRLSFIAVSFLCLAAPLASAQTVTKDIPYATDASGSYKADLYQPTGAGPFPAIVFLHGGSWRSGSKSTFSKLANDLAAHGYAGLSIDYDLKPHSWPLSLEETTTAVGFLRAHAREYHLDPARILIAGESAGAELAALVALDPTNHIAAAIMLNGVYDLTGNYHVIHRYLGGKCPDIGNVCRDASPMSHIHADAPAFFVGHGTSDHTVPFASAQLFTDDMKAAGNSVTFYPVKGAGHSYWSDDDYYADNIKAVEKFLATLR